MFQPEQIILSSPFVSTSATMLKYLEAGDSGYWEDWAEQIYVNESTSAKVFILPALMVNTEVWFPLITVSWLTVYSVPFASTAPPDVSLQLTLTA